MEARIHEAPSDPLANFLMSQIRAAFGDLETPLSFAEKAASLDSGTAKYHRQIAEILGIVAQQSSAFKQVFLARRFRHEIDTALSLDPHDAQALRDLMEFYILAPGIIGGDTQKASSMAERIAAADPVQGYLAWSRLAAFQNHSGEAENQLRHGAEAFPASYAIRIAQAQFYLSGTHPNSEAAAGAAQAALRLDPERVQAYAVLAEVEADRGNWTALDSVLEDAAKNVPDDLTPFFRAAERLIARGGESQRAERYLRRYLAQSPEGNEPTAAEAQQKLNLTLKAVNR